MRIPAFALAFSAALAILSPTNDALACRCTPPRTVAIAMKDATAVFKGKVTAVVKGAAPGSTLLVKFDVSTSWKGPPGATIEVRTASDGAACGLYFTEGAEWLVYASTNDGALSTGLCSRSKPLADAAEDLAQLGAGTPPPAPAPTPSPAPIPDPSAPSPSPSDSTPSTSPPGAPPPAPPGNEPSPVAPGAGGCACALAVDASDPHPLWLAALGALALVARRRARPSSAPSGATVPAHARPGLHPRDCPRHPVPRATCRGV
ncbi:hypothetical protein [Chondromyces apiculatus]|uniref:Uncharacterized protein n=1 Tax=Chondromyces apiculatus DSM 436 TaxID=1192034 RepID=A0A017TAM9_9BACT|nr:hypothetical protein [Chondromyces apiculatus]EYF05656.1 Hypothetical protein CAP_2946 [Chondromyces apiculatus DSM 436]